MSSSASLNHHELSLQVNKTEPWVVELNDKSREALLRAALDAPSPYADIKEFLAHTRFVAASLPTPLVRMLHDFRRDPAAPAVFMIRNLPRDPELPATPETGGRAVLKSSFVSESIAATVAQLFGDIFSYANEKNGELIHNIVPLKNKETSRSNEGSLSDFLLHTENAYFDFRPDYLLLNGLKTEEHAEALTPIASIKDALPYLSSAARLILRQNYFSLAPPDSHGQSQWSEPMALLSGCPHEPELRINFNGVRAIGKTAEAALVELMDAMNMVARDFVIEPGSIVLIDNRKAAHGRRPFSSNYGPNARWLQRLYVRSNLWQGRERATDRSAVFAF